MAAQRPLVTTIQSPLLPAETVRLHNQVGFALALYTDNILDFFLPLSLVMGTLALSVYWHLGLAESPLLWIIPSYPAMVLLASEVKVTPLITQLVALALLLAWNFEAFRLCRHVFHRRISARLDR